LILLEEALASRVVRESTPALLVLGKPEMLPLPLPLWRWTADSYELQQQEQGMPEILWCGWGACPARGRQDSLPLDVHFISSLPVMQGSVYKASVESKPAQMVGAEG